MRVTFEFLDSDVHALLQQRRDNALLVLARSSMTPIPSTNSRHLLPLSSDEAARCLFPLCYASSSTKDLPATLQL